MKGPMTGLDVRMNFNMDQVDLLRVAWDTLIRRIETRYCGSWPNLMWEMRALVLAYIRWRMMWIGLMPTSSSLNLSRRVLYADRLHCLGRSQLGQVCVPEGCLREEWVQGRLPSLNKLCQITRWRNRSISTENKWLFKASSLVSVSGGQGKNLGHPTRSSSKDLAVAASNWPPTSSAVNKLLCGDLSPENKARNEPKVGDTSSSLLCSSDAE